MLAPYRTEAAIDKYESKKYGLIKKTGENPWKIFFSVFQLFVDVFHGIGDIWNKHRCPYPKLSSRLWNAIKGSPFDDGSLYRCQCDKVWEYNKYRDKWEANGTWSLARWVEAGGEE